MFLPGRPAVRVESVEQRSSRNRASAAPNPGAAISVRGGRGSLREPECGHRACRDIDHTAETQERFITGQVASVNTPWMRFFLDYDPGPTLERVTAPVLALNGSLDLQVPSDQNLPVIERALEVAGNQDVTIEERAGLNQFFQSATTGSPNEYASINQTIDPSVLGVITAWILERFGG